MTSHSIINKKSGGTRNFPPAICPFVSLNLLFLTSFPRERWLSPRYFSGTESLSKISVSKMTVLICQIPGKHLVTVYYSQISRSIGMWDYPPGFSVIDIYNSIRTRFLCWKHGKALIWVIFTSRYALIDQIGWMWCELIKVAGFPNWLYWNNTGFDCVNADQIF